MQYLSINPFSTEPLYRQLKSKIKEAIINGQLKPGSLLPSEKTLREIFDISSTVVQQSYASLEEEGYIIRRRGSGTFVSHQFQESVLLPDQLFDIMFNTQSSHRFTGAYLLDHEVPKMLAKHLSYVKIKEVIKIKNHVNMLVESFIPKTTREKLEDFMQDSTTLLSFFKYSIPNFLEHSMNIHFSIIESQPFHESILNLVQSEPIHKLECEVVSPEGVKVALINILVPGREVSLKLRFNV
jgi:DNA-binding GntR family transcriptional regulator